MQKEDNDDTVSDETLSVDIDLESEDSETGVDPTHAPKSARPLKVVPIHTLREYSEVAAPREAVYCALARLPQDGLALLATPTRKEMEAMDDVELIELTTSGEVRKDAIRGYRLMMNARTRRNFGFVLDPYPYAALTLGDNPKMGVVDICRLSDKEFVRAVFPSIADLLVERLEICERLEAPFEENVQDGKRKKMDCC